MNEKIDARFSKYLRINARARDYEKYHEDNCENYPCDSVAKGACDILHSLYDINVKCGTLTCKMMNESCIESCHNQYTLAGATIRRLGNAGLEQEKLL